MEMQIRYFWVKHVYCLVSIILFLSDKIIEASALSSGVVSEDIKITTHFHLVLKLRMHGAMPPLHHMPGWCGV
jgi:hypothetical protein